MSDPKPVKVGEILKGIRAADHNAFYETWRKVNQFPSKRTPKQKPQAGGQLIVTVYNANATHSIDADFPILKITAPVVTPDERIHALHEEIWFEGDTPDAETQSDGIVIVQGPINDNGIGRGVLLGPSFVEIEWTDETHEFAAVKSGDNTQLKSASSGIQILWHEEIPAAEDLPATLWAIVLLGGGGTEQYRLIRGQSVGEQSSATILIDNIQVLAGGLDPSGGDTTVAVRVANIFTQYYADNEWVYAVYSPGASDAPPADWETLLDGADGDIPIIFLKNNSGSLRQNREVFGLGTPLIIPNSSFPDVSLLPTQPSFLSASPTQGKVFAIALAGSLPNEVFPALAVGVLQVKINYTNNAHKFADAITGTYMNLQSSDTGPAEIIWRANQDVAGNGTFGVQWAFVSLTQQKANSDDIRGVSYGQIAAASGAKDGPQTPGVGLAKLYTMPAGPAGTPWPINTTPVTVENWMHGTIPTYKPLLLRHSRYTDSGTRIYTIVSEGCAEVGSSEGGST